MDFAEKCNRIFWNVCQLRHQHDEPGFEPVNPYEEGSVEYALFERHWAAVSGADADSGALEAALGGSAGAVAAVERLSAVAIEVFRTDCEVRRADATPGCIEESRRKLRGLLERRQELTAEASRVLTDIIAQ